MADWKTELNALVEETTAFAKSLRVEPPMARTIVGPNRIPPVKGIESERELFRQRVANFKAHQQRFIREREDYVASEWKRMLASLAPPQIGRPRRRYLQPLASPEHKPIAKNRSESGNVQTIYVSSDRIISKRYNQWS
jgi:hypothetical protein